MAITMHSSFRWCSGIALLAITFYLFVIQAHLGNLMDFRIYLEAAMRWVREENIYSPAYQVYSRDQRPFELGYFYPPFLAWALSPIITLSYTHLKFAWCLLSYFALVGSAAIIAQLLGKYSFRSWHAHTRFFVAFFFLSCFEPIYAGISDGQVHILVLLLLLLFLRSRVLDSAHGGVALGAAILIKMSPALLTLGLLFERTWRTLAVVCAIIAATMIGLLVCGPSVSVYQDFFSPLVPLLSGDTSRQFVFNFATDRAVLNLLGFDSSHLARWMIKGLLVLTVLLVTCLVWGKVQQREYSLGSPHTLNLYAFLCSAMMLLSPLVWIHHLTWALVPLVILTAQIKPEGDPVRLKQLTGITALYFAFSQVQQVHVIALREYAWALPFTTLLPAVLLLITMALVVRRTQV